MSNRIERGKQVIQLEAAGIQSLHDRLDDSFSKAVSMILECKGKVIFTGMGKPGHIGKKLAATFSSTGTPAFFVHPAESVHGDSGMVEPHDIVIAMSNSGETAELLGFISIIKKIGTPIIAMTGNVDSTLAQHAVVVLDVSAEKEADKYNLAPTVTTTVTLAMGDALAVVLMEERGFSSEDFAFYHPGGSLGDRLKNE